MVVYLPGVWENEGEIVKQLGGKVCLNKSKNWLRNVGRVTSNNTAELTGVGEAILYFLQELRKTTPPLLTKLVIRTDSEYAENAIKGINRPLKKKIFK
jgi:ribonuclease HI